MKEIIINDYATINGNGEHTGGATKPVICIDTGMVYTSCTDAAKANGVSLNAMSQCCIGNIKRVKGKRFCYLSKVASHLDEMTARIQQLSEMEAKAKAYEVLMAEQEKARREKEKHDAAIAKAEAKVARREEISRRKHAEANKADELLNEAKVELDILKGNFE